MKFQATTLGLVILLIAPFSIAKTIAEICGNTQEIKKVETLEDYRAHLQNLNERFKHSEGVQSVSAQGLAVLDKIEEVVESDPTKQWFKAEELQVVSLLLAKEILAASRKKMSIPASPLRNELVSFFVRWAGKHEERIQNWPDYLNDMLGVLETIPVGDRIMNCFGVTPERQIQGISGQNIEVSAGYERDGYAMDFLLDKNRAVPGTYKQVIIFNPETDMIQAIEVLGHQFAHSCNTDMFVENALASETLMGEKDGAFEKGEQAKQDWISKWEKLQLKRDQEGAVDEVKAHEVSIEIAKEIAEVAPDMICDAPMSDPSLGYGLQVYTMGDHYSNLEIRKKDGSLASYVLDPFAPGRFSPQNLFEMDGENTRRDSSGLPVLRADLKEKLK